MNLTPVRQHSRYLFQLSTNSSKGGPDYPEFDDEGKPLLGFHALAPHFPDFWPEVS
jgi:hypothetical protein